MVGVEVDSSHARFVPTTGRPRGDDGVSEGAICQPASIALVQTLAPGSIELAGGGQGGILKSSFLLRHPVWHPLNMGGLNLIFRVRAFILAFV